MLNQVHDIQQVYRRVVDALSRPGTIQDLSDAARKLDHRADCYGVTLVLARMLLDTEVTFKVIGDNEDELTQHISRLTYAKRAEVHEADYIFVTHTAVPGSLSEALKLARIGEMNDPHLSATLIAELPNVVGGERRLLRGPGIDQYTMCEMQTTGDWEAVRAERNAEFPLGVDMIFADGSHRVLALPRTTQMEKEVH
ncbi:phosphonate C-P lyase system protein PhnH [Paenibacillus urinalis]|uniref:phosphonate C-P lyase system protein PhnH n=1 Tax=Paenibacillus urinalis TaxID=521520 RepID=UPI00196064A3